MRIVHVTLDANEIENRRPRDDDDEQVRAIFESMMEAGWIGRPVVVYRLPNRAIRNITGCARIEAAYLSDTPVEAVLLSPESTGEEDTLWYAASNDDFDAAHALRWWVDVSELVARG